MACTNMPPPPAGCEEFVSCLENLFSLSLNDSRGMIKDFHEEMRKGLSGQASSLKMLPSFVDRPTGKERGNFLALDLGGTNFRVLAVQLDGKGCAAVQAVRKFAVSGEAMQGTGEQLFDFIADGIDAFLTENRMKRSSSFPLAFTFSFPVAQTGIASGRLLEWTKGFTATGVKGRDVVGLLNDALKRKGISCIAVSALVNDTIGTMVARSYGDPTCDMGVILGTGTNACYREKRLKIEKLKDRRFRKYIMINMEWGNFHKVRLTGYDEQVDGASVNPGAMHFEKLVSGMYLGELTRLVLMDAIERRLLFLHEPKAAGAFGQKGLFRTEDMSLIAEDETTDLLRVEGFLQHRGITVATPHDKTFLKHLCEITAGRSARLGATAISSVISWMDPELKDRHTVAVDGTLFEKYPHFKTGIIAVLQELHGAKAEKILLVHSKDGSGLGAAIVAAVAAAESGLNG